MATRAALSGWLRLGSAKIEADHGSRGNRRRELARKQRPIDADLERLGFSGLANNPAITIEALAAIRNACIHAVGRNLLV